MVLFCVTYCTPLSICSRIESAKYSLDPNATKLNELIRVSCQLLLPLSASSLLKDSFMYNSSQGFPLVLTIGP
jgi:hypothetical protein